MFYSPEFVPLDAEARSLKAEVENLKHGATQRQGSADGGHWVNSLYVRTEAHNRFMLNQEIWVFTLAISLLNT